MELATRDIEILKNRLLATGVERLRAFGFVNVTKANILEDEVYRYYLKKNLSILLGQSDKVDAGIMELFNTMQETSYEKN